MQPVKNIDLAIDVEFWGAYIPSHITDGYFDIASSWSSRPSIYVGIQFAGLAGWPSCAVTVSPLSDPTRRADRSIYQSSLSLALFFFLSSSSPPFWLFIYCVFFFPNLCSYENLNEVACLVKVHPITRRKEGKTHRSSLCVHCTHTHRHTVYDCSIYYHLLGIVFFFGLILSSLVPQQPGDPNTPTVWLAEL